MADELPLIANGHGGRVGMDEKAVDGGFGIVDAVHGRIQGAVIAGVALPLVVR